jgi:Rrf2 family transcriptional regulator, iron-sulfur cluster assembly transcription factor
MIYSRPSEYAIRAIVHLAQVPEGTYAMVEQIATEEQIPRYFLAKILHQVACRGLLRSKKGRTGGFALCLPADKIRLVDIVEALDGLAEYERCASGLGKCSNDMPCALHNSWRVLRSRILDYLGRNTIADLAKTVEQKHQLRDKRRRGKRTPVGSTLKKLKETIRQISPWHSRLAGHRNCPG